MTIYEVAPPTTGVPQAGRIVTGELFSEPMQVETAVEAGDGMWRLGLVGTQAESNAPLELEEEPRKVFRFGPPRFPVAQVLLADSV